MNIAFQGSISFRKRYFGRFYKGWKKHTSFSHMYDEHAKLNPNLGAHNECSITIQS